MGLFSKDKHSPPSSTQEPTSSRSSTGDADRIETVPSVDNPFATPGAQTPDRRSSRAGPQDSAAGSRASDFSGTSSGYSGPPRAKYFKSRRVNKTEIERPWLEKKDPREKWVTIIPLIGLFLGLCITGVLIWDGVRSVAKHNYCEVLNDDFKSWNDKVWTKQVELGGFG